MNEIFLRNGVKIVGMASGEPEKLRGANHTVPWYDDLGYWGQDIVLADIVLTPPIAAIFVDTTGCYSGLRNVDVWGIERDARTYSDILPVVAHPPCERWGKYWHGSPRKPHQYKLGDDKGCFEAALRIVRENGGVLEHPKDSHAWAHFGIAKPPHKGGWVKADDHGGWTCCVEQGHYGHISRKATWLYACGIAEEDLPELIWGPSPQKLNQWAVEKYGYEYARRAGVMSYLGGKDKSKLRAATPPAFRDILIKMARSVTNGK